MSFTEERGMPANIETEKFILGSLMIDGSRFDEIAGVLIEDDFSLEKHRRIFARMCELRKQEQPVDRVTVANELHRLGELESIDGLSYLVSLDDGLPHIANLDGYVTIIREKAALRRGALMCQHAMNRFLQAEEASGEIISSLISTAQQIETVGGSPEWQLATDIIREFPGGWQALVSPAAKDNNVGVPLPWPRLQNVTCGLQKGELIILAGRPSMGKSALAMQIAMHAAKRNFGVAYVSLEMSGPALVRREVSQDSRVDASRMKLGYLNYDERSKLVETRNIVETLPIHIESKQTRGRTVSSILASLRWLKARNVVDMVVIDHFHLIDGPEREERIKYNRIADALQRAARDMQIPFIVLAQLNRKCEEDRREPGLPDLKECGKIEENADLVMFIHRAEMYAHLRDREDLKGMADLIVAKQRDGMTGKVELIFIGNQMRFESRAEDLQ